MPNFDTGDVFRYAQVAEEVVREAGRDIIYEAVRKEGRLAANKRIKTKLTFSDLVTEVDEETEQFITKSIRKRLGDDVSFIGEESLDKSGKVTLTDAPTFIIDPIDGTSNFVHGFPAFAVSVGLCVNREMVAGIIYDVMQNQCYTAMKGQGAFLDHQKQLKVSGCQTLKQSLVICGSGGREDETLDNLFYNWRAVTERSHGLRTTGSAAYNLFSVASGRAEAFFDDDLHCWDVAAGVLLVTEAGGYVCDILEDKPFDLMSRRLLACNSPRIAAELQAVVKASVLPRDDEEKKSKTLYEKVATVIGTVEEKVSKVL